MLSLLSLLHCQFLALNVWLLLPPTSTLISTLKAVSTRLIYLGIVIVYTLPHEVDEPTYISYEEGYYYL